MMTKPKTRMVVAALCLGVWAAPPALAWKLKPEATAMERGLAASSARVNAIINGIALTGLTVVGSPVHEDITRRALQCPIDNGWPELPRCEGEIQYQLDGVRWNDDPAFQFRPGRGERLGCTPGKTVRLVTQPTCWPRVFHHGESMASPNVSLSGRNSNLLARSHFGDLQFLHAMAIADGESADVTRRKVLAWLEFTWRTAMGDPRFGSQHLLYRLPIDGFAEHFRFNQGWRIQDLFALGSPSARTVENIQKIALGSLLHVVEDSFAAGHVERMAPIIGTTCPGRVALPAPGQIVEFHSYTHQNSLEHGRADKQSALDDHVKQTSPNVIDVVHAVGQMWRDHISWDEARPYLECVFALAPNPRSSSPGRDFQIDKRETSIGWKG